jgi:endoglucanase
MPVFHNQSLRTAALTVAAAAFAAAITAQTVNSQIRVSSVGFLPDMPKKATIADGAASAAFKIMDALSGDSVYGGTLPSGRASWNTDTRDSTRIADFSEFKTSGEYYLQVAGVDGRGPNFKIAADVFNDPYRAMMLGMYLWRCGSEVNADYKGKNFSHGACHLSDARVCHDSGSGVNRVTICVGDTINIGINGIRDAKKGWHDAGDYNKYTVNSGITVGIMLKAWEDNQKALEKIDLLAVNTSGAYEAGLPKFLSEVKWNLDWVAKMQYGDNDGRVSHKLSAINFCGEIMPEKETAARYFSRWSTAATGSFVGMMAQAARIYEPYDKELADSWLEKAKLSYDVLWSSAFVRETQAPFNTGGYGSSSDNDKRLWAAVEMWETTGESKYLQDFESRPLPNMYADLGWADVNALAGVTYLMSEKPGRRQTRVDSLKTNLFAVANRAADSSAKHAYGRPFGSGGYYWGSHGALTAYAYILNAAAKLTDNTGDRERYRSAGHDILGYVFGRNYFARSFVTGVGYNPPEHPHCRRSTADGFAWPGYIIGGPHSGNLTENNGSPIAPPGATCSAPGSCYFDYEGDYARNEIAINWNGSMIYALSGFLAEEKETSIRTNRVTPVSALPKIKMSKMINVRSGRAVNIPAGAKIYTLDGRLIAQRKQGDPMPVIRRSGMFIMKLENQQPAVTK